MRLTLARTGEALATDCRLASNFWTRFKGLMGRRELPAGEGLLIVPCNSVHCFFMRIPIDVVYLSREGVVLRVVPALKPWRTGPFVRGARMVLELPAGTTAQAGLAEGDVVTGLPGS